MRREFEKNTDCFLDVGEIGPRSLLKLNYKGQIASVHV